MERYRTQGNPKVSKRSIVNSSHYSQGKTEAGASICNRDNSDRGVSGKKGAQSMLGDLAKKLSSIKSDSDKLMILALMIILAREGADKRLILALGYILL